jgi:hypothetical protein
MPVHSELYIPFHRRHSLLLLPREPTEGGEGMRDRRGSRVRVHPPFAPHVIARPKPKITQMNELLTLENWKTD